MQHIKNFNLYNKILIVGGGSWGTALASVAANNIPEVVIYDRNPETIASINDKHINSKYLPDIILPSNLMATNGNTHFNDAELILLAIPAQVVRQVLTNLKDKINNHVPLLISTKGIEHNTLKLMSDICLEILPSNPVAIISGPNFANEIALKKPAAAVIASKDQQIALRVINTFGNDYFRPYYSDDIVGVQIGGATKNVVAIAAGIAEGMNLGENAKAALISRGLAEMARLTTHMQGKLETTFGLSGLGDLVLTCGSQTSRNMSLGYILGQTRNIKEVLPQNTTYEGYHTALSIHQLTQKTQLDLPIFEAVYRILYEEADINEEISKFMSRPFGTESY
jgi:glycerol-3-phosphate dehydrogenase (NAD(P)+)